MARLVAPPAAGALDVPALVPVPLPAADEVAADVEAPAADELELEPPQAAMPSASAAALRRRAGSLNMAEISFFVVSRDGPGCPATPREC
jgi:hypothetical protein